MPSIWHKERDIRCNLSHHPNKRRSLFVLRGIPLHLRNGGADNGVRPLRAGPGLGQGLPGESMGNPFNAFCEDFYVNMRLGSQLNLPHNRETILHFFEQVQKGFPGMTRFRKSDNGELNLEEDRSRESYRWMSVEAKRLSSGHVNPGGIDDAL